jgi:hypothetical protein
VPKGRVDDLLYLFTKDEPGMSGDITVNGKFLWPPGPREFLEKTVAGKGLNGLSWCSSSAGLSHSPGWPAISVNCEGRGPRAVEVLENS